MKKNQKRSIELASMAVELIEPDNLGTVPYGVRLSVNKEADEKYRKAFGKNWDALLYAYQESLLAANKLFVAELTKLCMGEEDGKTETEKLS